MGNKTQMFWSDKDRLCLWGKMPGYLTYQGGGQLFVITAPKEKGYFSPG